jgi:hypothetical protein
MANRPNAPKEECAGLGNHFQREKELIRKRDPVVLLDKLPSGLLEFLFAGIGGEVGGGAGGAAMAASVQLGGRVQHC